MRPRNDLIQKLAVYQESGHGQTGKIYKPT